MKKNIKKENNNADVNENSKDRKIVLNAIGEKEKEVEKTAGAEINGEFLDEMKKTNDFLKLKNSSIQKERKSAEVLAEIEEKEIKEERFVSVDNSLKQEKIKPPKIKIIKNKIRASFLKKAGCILSAAILFFLIFYSLLALVITRFNLDNAQSRFLSRYFPVPALISKLGMVGFYDYKDMREAGDNDNLKADLIKEMMKNSGGEIDEIKVWSLVE